jgi:hypothetical protein
MKAENILKSKANEARDGDTGKRGISEALN